MDEDANPWARVIYSRAFAAGEPALVQVRFHASVLDRYREQGLEIKRTDTVGRLKKAGGWSLDFGIGGGDRTIHAALGDLLQRLPQQELEDWARQVAQSDLSESYCKMRIHPGSCIDDGDLPDRVGAARRQAARQRILSPGTMAGSAELAPKEQERWRSLLDPLT